MMQPPAFLRMEVNFTFIVTSEMMEETFMKAFYSGLIGKSL